MRLLLILRLLLLSAPVLAQDVTVPSAVVCPGDANISKQLGKETLKLLLMLPFSESSVDSEREPWDRGGELLPAACLAVQQVNNHSQFLQGLHLKLMTVDIEPCRLDEYTSNINAMLPLIDISSTPQNDVLGIVGGPFCPPLLTELVSPLASKNQSFLFKMYGSTEESVRGEQDMHFITSSIKLHYEAVYAMMRVFGWEKLYVLYESFFNNLQSVEGSNGLNITFRQFDSNSAILPDLRQSEKNIVFVSLSAEHAADVLCLASEGSLTYPDYVWIFHDLTPYAILDSRSGECEEKALKKALNSTFFLNFPFSPDSNDATLDSDITYSDYISRLNSSTASNPFASVIYDSIWATGLALNRSLEGEVSPDFSSREAKRVLIERMNRVIPEISFQGASGMIDFSTARRAVNDAVDIYLYSNATLRHIGRYNTTSNLSIAETVVPPDDELSREYVLIPGFVTGVLAMSIIICLVLTVLILLLFVYYRNDPDIKATSPHLSYLMFLGCFLLLSATLLHTIRGALAISGPGGIVVCGAVVTGDSLGVNLIFATLLLRMLRVYRIFSHFGKTGKLWSNRNMACIVGVILLGDIVVIAVWSIVDTYVVRETVTFRAGTNPPHYEVRQFCYSNHQTIWLGILLGKLAVLFVIVLFLAIKTRKIRKSNFKDTKKVNIYIFSTVANIIIFMTLFFLFTSRNSHLAAHLVVYFAFGFTALLCQLFLFVPKVASPLLKKWGYEVSYGMISGQRRHTIQLRRQSQSRKSLATMMGNMQFTEAA
jgi:gamma-aminobutyric acid type B receptor